MTLVTLLILSIIQALTFSITVSQDKSRIVLRYPKDADVKWIEVCVEADGHGDAGKGEDPEQWYSNSCWLPAHPTEEYRLKTDTFHVRAHLEVDVKGVRSRLDTPVTDVRQPEEGPE